MSSINSYGKIAAGFAIVLCLARAARTSAIIVGEPSRGNSIYTNFGAFDWYCESDDTCTTPGSFCNYEEKCECAKGFVFNGAMTKCLKVATSYGDECVDSAQCVVYLSVGGTCNDGVCNCDTGYHYLHGQCHKSSGLGDKCEINDDCYVNADAEALTCRDKVCKCSDGFYQREYRTCRRSADADSAECTIDLDCRYNTNARCNKVEGCYVKADNTYISKYGIEEIASRETGGHRWARGALLFKISCTEDSDCTNLNASICSERGECICRRGWSFDSTRTNCIPDIGEHCLETHEPKIRNSMCRNNTWSCTNGTVTSGDNRVCRKTTTVINGPCLHDEQCYVFGPDAFCSKTCKCNNNSHYVEEEMFCWSNVGIGEKCLHNNDCYVEGFLSKLTCNNASECDCPVGTHVNGASTGCISDETGLGDPCSNDIDCMLQDNAKCLNGLCQCEDNYFNASNVCVPGIGTECDGDEQCRTNSSTCDANVCKCISDFVSPLPGICVAGSPIGGECRWHIQCSAKVTDALCFVPGLVEPDGSTDVSADPPKGTCKCDIDHHERNNKCHKSRVLGESCTSSAECYVESNIESVLCSKGICTCSYKAIEVNPTFCNDSSTCRTFPSWIVAAILFSMNFLR